jgi:hypothetical protein
MTETDKEVKDKIVALAIAFQLETGADMIAIKWFVKSILDVTTEYSTRIVREEISKIMRP